MVCLQLESFQILQENLFTNIMEASDDIRKRGLPLFKIFSSLFFPYRLPVKWGKNTILKLHNSLKNGAFLKIKN